MSATTDDAIEVFVDAGLLAAEQGVLPDAGQSLADRLIAEGHADILAELTARFWMANSARLARRDRWAAAARVRAGLDPGEKEPPPPPPPPEKPPPPPPTEDSSAAAATATGDPVPSLVDPPSPGEGTTAGAS